MARPESRPPGARRADACAVQHWAARRLAVSPSSTWVSIAWPVLEQGSRLCHEQADRGRRRYQLQTGVAAVHPDHVEFADGSKIAARTVVWGGGESASIIAQAAGPVPGRGGRLDVLPDLKVNGFPGVYAVGDVANIPSGDDDSVPLHSLGP